MKSKTSGRVVYTATHGWYEIVTRNGELALADSFEGNWQAAAALAGLDTDDPEAWVARVEEIGERHTALKAGDYCCCGGYGSDVVFVRLAD